ncbi:MAG: nitrate reductase molybdenum cofactor assembly chaperone [Roseateles sp.]
MFNKKSPKQADQPLRLSCRVLAHLLDYPGAAMRAALPELREALHQEGALGAQRLAELDRLLSLLQRGDAYEVEARYVESFDRGRASSLHLFEHVHGDSRSRGPALVDLVKTYEAGGMFFDGAVHGAEGQGDASFAQARELPDYLPVVLEFASTQAPATARAFLAELAHILNSIHAALIQRESPYAAAIGAVLELAGEQPRAMPLAPEESLDESWQEPAAFEGCSVRGQSGPQPVHIVRKHSSTPNAQQGGRV